MSFLKIKLRSPIVIVIGLFFVSQLSSAQVSEEKSFFYQADSFSQARFNGMMTSTVSGSAISITILSKQWYSDYETVPFHWFNDNDQWLLMDKLGHGVTSYYGGVYGYNALRWTGLSEKKVVTAWWGVWVFISSFYGINGWFFFGMGRITRRFYC